MKQLLSVLLCSCAVAQVTENNISEPGYWYASVSDTSVVWTPGMRHYRNTNVIASAVEGDWEFLPGYVPTGAEFETRWCPGLPHTYHSGVIAGKKEGEWIPAPGYVWKDKSNLSVQWQPGLIHDYAPGLKAGWHEGNFMPLVEGGYRWADNNGTEERPDPTIERWNQFMARGGFRIPKMDPTHANVWAAFKTIQGIIDDVRPDIEKAWYHLVSVKVQQREVYGSHGRTEYRHLDPRENSVGLPGGPMGPRP